MEFWLFWDSISDQAGLKLRDPPASASQVLRLKACTTTPGQGTVLKEDLVPDSSWRVRRGAGDTEVVKTCLPQSKKLERRPWG